jgi:hypothetical protein
MSPTEPVSSGDLGGILVSLESLFGDDSDTPAPLPEAAVALERLAWIGRPVVLVGDEIAGRRLPADPQQRLAWVRARFDVPDLAALTWDEPVVIRAGEALERTAVDRWSTLRDDLKADRLITRRESSVGPARRAGFTVVRIGPRGPAPGPSIERADHEARDLLDAVSRLMTADVFGASRGH